MENIYGQNQPLQPRPDNNMVWAILCTVLCCLPLGIVSILSASKVDQLYAQGLYDAAVEESKKAKKWAMIGMGTGLGAVVLYILFYILIIAVSVMAD